MNGSHSWLDLKSSKSFYEILCLGPILQAETYIVVLKWSQGVAKVERYWSGGHVLGAGSCSGQGHMSSCSSAFHLNSFSKVWIHISNDMRDRFRFRDECFLFKYLRIFMCT